jgi:hypothetical protein
VLAAVLAFSAVRKLGHDAAVVESYRRAGVPEDRLDALAAILLAAASGLVVGVIWTPVGTATAIAVAVYFVVAVGFHVRSGDTRHALTPLTIAVAAAVTAALRLEG